MTNLQNRVDAYNSTTGSETGEDCPICKNRGKVAFIADGNIFMVRDCECMERRRQMRNLERSGLKSLAERCTFDTYETPGKEQKHAKEKALQFLQSPGSWFVISGSSGSGKTHLCTAMCTELIKRNRKVLYMRWREAVPKLKALVTISDLYEKEIEQYKLVDVLYIDDFFKGNVTQADINIAFEIIDHRYSVDKLQTIISSEKSPTDLAAFDAAIAGRIYERSKGFCINAPAANWRTMRNG